MTAVARLSGRVAVVTGGAGGLGSATCRRLAADGAAVVVADIEGGRAQALADEIGGDASAATVDVAEPESVRALIDGVVTEHGRLDVLHNNAAASAAEHISQDTTVVDTPLEVWDRTFQVNFRGYVLGCRYAIPHMLDQGAGVIVNTSSDAGRSGDVARTAYGCSKAAILALTEYVATQYGKRGIRCVAITPGAMLTAPMREVMGEEALAVLERHHLTPYLGEPEDVANLVAFLVSDEAKFLTGINVPLDGGYLSHQPTFADFSEP